MKDQFIEACRKYMYQLDEFPIEDVQQEIQKELEWVLSLNEDKVLKERLAYHGVGVEADYLNKYIKTSQGKVLAGIRHLNGNKAKPFVSMWPSFQIQDLDSLVQELQPYFQVFKPLAYHFWTRPDCNTYKVPIYQQRYYGVIKDMVKYDETLVEPKDYYDWYENQYKLFHERRPDLKDRVPVNSKDLMDQCLEHHLLYEILDGDQVVGLIAGEKESFVGKSTIYIDEILIADTYQGKGLAGKLLGSFLKDIGTDLITCHIDSKNIPSSKTALRSGQIVFAQECTYLLEG